MSAKKGLSIQDYRKKLQEAADELTSVRNVEKIEVIHLSRDNFGCAREGAQLCLPILEEARSRVNEKYELNAETQCASKPNVLKVP
jgi:hypothetical protein